MRDDYSGNDQIHTASGTGMEIQQIGQSIVRFPDHKFLLNNVLYAPKPSKNLIFVHRFTTDNDAFVEFHPNFFLVKDRATKRVLLRGRCQGGLYPLRSDLPNKLLVPPSSPRLDGTVVWVIHHRP